MLQYNASAKTVPLIKTRKKKTWSMSSLLNQLTFRFKGNFVGFLVIVFVVVVWY